MYLSRFICYAAKSLLDDLRAQLRPLYNANVPTKRGTFVDVYRELMRFLCSLRFLLWWPKFNLYVSSCPL